MEEKIRRQQITERDLFSYEERQRISAKSKDRCCKCGRKVYIGYGATVDHFVPIIKGGVNRDVNLVMMCEECNKQKGDMIVPPEDYLKFLEEPYRTQTEEYFDSYIRSFEYIERGNVLACDQYTVYVVPPLELGRKGYPNAVKSPHLLKRAGQGDIEKMQAYYLKYLKKTGCLDSVYAANMNIQFWMKFGCIYYIEKNGDIKCMAAITKTQILDGSDFVSDSLSLNIFCYYSTMYAFILANGIMENIPQFVMREQNLKQLPVRIGALKSDSLTVRLLRAWDDSLSKGTLDMEDDRILHRYFIQARDGISETEWKSLPNPAKDESLIRFFGKFQNIREEIVKWYEVHTNAKELQWMALEIGDLTEDDWKYLQGLGNDTADATESGQETTEGLSPAILESTGS